jgi:hypothetical protein
MSMKLWLSAIGPVAVAATAVAIGTAPASIAGPNSFQCPPQNGLAVAINVGDVDCVTASDVAAQYDPNGDKYQQIGSFTCYSGNAMTAPLLFQCVAETEDQAEFAVYPG